MYSSYENYPQMKYNLSIEELFCAAVSKLRDLDWIIIWPI